ncbi:DUF6236 family protein [Nocardioides sp. 616]|uniref:DUF6236 family protein n=1 Tax=Nocardioides sp. 616 TaxID=2268090 RepID=UPI000CE4CC76|nr:DUF6236 family protein [Nocardioides sp. 616]
MRAMLYYPFVQPPHDVLTQGVLYWDQVGSIVPEHYVLPEYLRVIEREGLYRPVHIDQYFDDLSLDAIASEVEQLLRRLSPRDLALPPDPVTPATRLYFGKLPMILEEMLMDRGVIADAGETFQGTRELLGPLLALLARSVAEAEPDPSTAWVCHTDVDKAHAAAFDGPLPGAIPAWRVNMSDVFKVPVAGTDLEELLDFRQRYEGERIALLRAVDHFVDSVGGPEAQDLLPRIAEEVDYAVGEIERAMAGRGIKIKKTVVYGTVAAGVGAAANASSLLGPVSEAAAAGAFGVVGSMLMSASSAQVRATVSSPYNYVHRGRQQFATN